MSQSQIIYNNLLEDNQQQQQEAEQETEKETKPLSRQRRWQLKQQSKGLCHLCGGQLFSKSLCEKCLVSERVRNRKRMKCGDGEKSGRGRPAMTRTIKSEKKGESL